MNRKQFGILLTLVVVIGAAALLVHQQGRQSWRDSSPAIGRKLLPALPVNDIAQITIKSATNELNLARLANLWRVRERGNYPADFSQISGLLLKFADLKIAQTEEVGPSQLGRFALLPPGAGANSATLVEFKDAAGGVRASVLLGKRHLKKPAANPSLAGMDEEGWPDGRYVMVGDGATSIAVVSDALDSAQPAPGSWLDKDFFSIENPRSISVQFPEATNSWKLTRVSATNDWQLAGANAGEKLDTAKISAVANPFASPTFNDVGPADAQTKLTAPTNPVVLAVETFDGFSYRLNIGPKQMDDYPVTLTISADLPAERAKAAGEKPGDTTRLDKEFADRRKNLAEKLAREANFTHWIYQLPTDEVDPVLKRRGDLLVESSPPTDTNSPAAK